MKIAKFIFVSVTALFLVFILGFFAGRNHAGAAMSVSVERGTVPETIAIYETPKVEKININTADLRTMCSLPGIGETIAQRIIDYRSEHGSFLTIEQIMDVKGIGEKIFLEIKSLITVGE